MTLTKAEQEQARRIFIQLIQPGEGTEDTRRMARKEEMGEESWPLIQKLADARLIVTNRGAAGGETVEMVHEALIRRWRQLEYWMNEDRAFRVWQEKLRFSQRQWAAAGQAEAVLLRGFPLNEALKWQSERGVSFSQSELDFIQASTRQTRATVRFRRVAYVGVLVVLLIFVWLRKDAILLQRCKANCTFWGAFLSGVDWSGEYLSFVDLSKANLSGSDLSEAILLNANLSGVN